MTRNSEVYATAQEMAAKYRLSAYTVRSKVQTGEWPCDRIGRLYRFSPAQQDEIALIIAGNSQRPRAYDQNLIAAALHKLSDADGAN